MSDDAERRSRVSGAARRSADEAAERVAAARERLHAARLSAGDAHERAAQLHDRAAGGASVTSKLTTGLPSGIERHGMRTTWLLSRISKA
ncbi:hypothetical protein [Mycobacterium avium]|uniref:hypothetical protein n=1 Tax=Mycobacterium avium TaxID=1764 RepID=UPI000B0834AF|nr:hypothetical protein [Mycobacterium avium]QBB84596.1 hypothetical protein BJP74_23630 [Mycobacterium avium subsp. hominissuis]QBB84766.1 hypothetical protein BEP52_24040 [Mycobacterium avium subsp. hominissuis]QBC16860.1 hypothetical protein BJP78_23975 [Mycobacterium avium subsp. hominissuis]QBZ39358.1 hypothetical protein KV38_26365 [Mycobacterium avium subsp. hominissuis]WOF20413.1 hypothetical protein IHV82_07440 [Mycobacterium avium]